MNENIIRIIVEILLIIVILIGFLYKRITDKKNNDVNLELIPGHSEECTRRGDEIAKTTEAIKRIDTNLDNIWMYVKKNGKR